MKIGYKGMKNGECRNVKFEIGKTYLVNQITKEVEESNLVDHNHENKNLKLCTDQVIHYCNELKDVHEFYNFGLTGNSFYKVQILGGYIDEGTKSGTDCIKILEEISTEEVERVDREAKRDIKDKEFGLENIRKLQDKFPILFIGGSLGLYLRGYNLPRFNYWESDYDLISPYYIDLTEQEGVEEAGEEKNSGNDFDSTFFFGGRKMDLRIDPKERYEIITYRGHKYKVGSFINTIEAKARYAKQKGGQKHLEDLVELMSQNKQEWL